MANTISAAKNARKAMKRHTARVSAKSELKTLRKNVLEAAHDKKPATEIQTIARHACSRIAKAASNKYIHPRTASRKISRLMKQVHKATQTPQTA
jgi:small subunit ribosomal protein S20